MTTTMTVLLAYTMLSQPVENRHTYTLPSNGMSYLMHETKVEEGSSVCSKVDAAAELGFILLGCLYLILTIGSKLDKVVGAWRRAELKFPWLPVPVAIALVLGLCTMGGFSYMGQVKAAQIAAAPFEKTKEQKTMELQRVAMEGCNKMCEGKVTNFNFTYDILTCSCNVFGPR